MEYSQTLKLDIRDNHTYEQIYTKQSDKGYPLVFEITEDGKPFDLTGINASFRMTKPDGNIVLEDCTISDNTVSVDLSEQMTAVSGKCPFEISLSDGSSRVTTITGLIKVDASAVQSSTVSESTIDLIIYYASNAEQSANNSLAYSIMSQSYAVGTGGYRHDEATDNSLYYYEQAKDIVESLSGTLMPAGTIPFEQLDYVTKLPGYMYNISNEFTTTAEFKEGAGHVMPMGTNVYRTIDDMWDCLAGSPVTGIKGDNEFSYRKGNVNITKDNIGLGNVANKFSQAIIVSDTEPTTQEVGDFWLQPYN